MPFSTRNTFYIRISKNIVIPAYVYLDERHVNWMSDAVLQHVLSDLRPYLPSKLKAEADTMQGKSAQKQTIDTHRGETYQFCYFIRKTEPHSVVIKNRHFRVADSRQIAQHVEPQNDKKGKRKKQPDDSPSRRQATKKRPRRVIVDSSEGINSIPPVHEEGPPQGEEDTGFDDAVMQVEVEEDKPKPVLALKYQGFSIYGQCLCIVVEPLPVGQIEKAFENLEAPTDSMLEGSSSRQNPLFLPDDDDEVEIVEQTHRTSSINKEYLHQVLHSEEWNDKTPGGMIEFSQVLRGIGDTRPGAVDDEDRDESMLFGDADENREF